MDAKLAKVNYRCRAGNQGKKMLFRQVLWEIYLPAPKHVPRPKANVSSPNAVHRDDPLFTTRPKWTQDFQTRLTVVYVASHFKRSQTFDITKLRRRSQSLRFRCPLKWPEMLQLDPGKQFLRSVSKEMKYQNCFSTRKE